MYTLEGVRWFYLLGGHMFCFVLNSAVHEICPAKISANLSCLT